MSLSTTNSNRAYLHNLIIKFLIYFPLHKIAHSLDTVVLHHCTTTEMVADIFTKALTGILFDRHSETISGKRKHCLEAVMVKSEKQETQDPEEAQIFS